MKAIVLMLLIPLVALAAPREIDRGNKTRETKVFDVPHPYTITWSLTFPQPAYKGHEPDKTVTVFVYDAETDRIIASKLGAEWNGSLKVHKGGKHYLWISSQSAWIMRIEDNPPNPHEAVTLQQMRAAEAMRKALKDEAELVRKAMKEAPAPKPSSVPGLPPGVEPNKGKETDLPPGMTKGRSR
jgi:hypothetical protein